MRLTAFILAILVLILSCLPCADVDTLPDIKTELAKHSGSVPHHDHKDLCSPFCHCSCCSTYSLVSIPLLLPDVTERPVAPVYTAYISKAVIEISLPVWQPPQLA